MMSDPNVQRTADQRLVDESRKQQSYRLKVTEEELAKFHIPMGQPKENPHGRRSLKLIELTPTRLEIGDRPLVITAENWKAVQALAKRHNGGAVGIDLPPWAALSFGRALTVGLDVALEPSLRDDVNAVIRLA